MYLCHTHCNFHVEVLAKDLHFKSQVEFEIWSRVKLAEH